MIHTAPSNSDEPSAKKHSGSGYGSLSNASAQKPPPFVFSPNFNFSGSQQTNSAQPHTIASNTAPPNANVFTFGLNTQTAGGFIGSTEAKSPNAPYPFGGSSDVTNNIFAPQPSSTNSAMQQAAIQQRRKIRAVRRTPR
jgi:hypothetical protein